MSAVGVRVGDKVKVERITYTGWVESYKQAHGLGGIGGHDEMVVRDEAGNAHYFDPQDHEVLVTVVPPEFKSGQVWETPDGRQWFIRRSLKDDFCAMPTGSLRNCSKPEEFRDMSPRLVWPKP
jgi:hypothetical protein